MINKISNSISEALSQVRDGSTVLIGGFGTAVPDESAAAEGLTKSFVDDEADRIAEALGLSPRTVESHISAMLEKTGCRHRTQLLLWGQKRGMSTTGVAA